MVDYLLKKKYITHDNIKYTVQAQLSVKHDYYNTFIDKCYSQLPDDLTKLSINSMIGNFKPNVDKRVSTESICITTNKHAAKPVGQQTKSGKTSGPHKNNGKKILKNYLLI